MCKDEVRTRRAFVGLGRSFLADSGGERLARFKTSTRVADQHFCKRIVENKHRMPLLGNGGAMNIPLTRLASDALEALHRRDRVGSPDELNSAEVREHIERAVHAEHISHLLQKTQPGATAEMTSGSAGYLIHSPAMSRPARSTRKPRISHGTKRRNGWSEEQEAALLVAMDDAETDWALIISRYGQGGTVNQSLRDRDKAALYDKAVTMKKKMLKQGQNIPPRLEGISTRGRNRSAQVDRDEEYVEETAEERVRRHKRHAAHSAPTEGEPRVRSEAIEIIDDESEEGRFKVEDAEPREVSKFEPDAAKTDSSNDEDYEMMDLQLQRQLQAAAREEAVAKREEANAKQEEMRLEREMLKLKRQRKSQ